MKLLSEEYCLCGSDIRLNVFRVFLFEKISVESKNKISFFLPFLSLELGLVKLVMEELFKF
jgi:hypothetical protein